MQSSSLCERTRFSRNQWQEKGSSLCTHKLNTNPYIQGITLCRRVWCRWADLEGRILCIVSNSGVWGLVSLSGLGFSMSTKWELPPPDGSMWKRSGVFCWNLWTRSAMETNGETGLLSWTERHLCNVCTTRRKMRLHKISEGAKQIPRKLLFWISLPSRNKRDLPCRRYEELRSPLNALSLVYRCRIETLGGPSQLLLVFPQQPSRLGSAQ